MPATVTVVNGTGSALTNVNAAGDDVPAYGFGKDGVGKTVVLTDIELAALVNTAGGGVAVLLGTSTQEQRRLVSKVLRLGKNPGA